MVLALAAVASVAFASAGCDPTIGNESFAAFANLTGICPQQAQLQSGSPLWFSGSPKAAGAATPTNSKPAPASVIRAPGPGPELKLARGPPSPVKPAHGTGSSSPTGLFQPIQERTPASAATQSRVAACQSYLEEYWQKLHAYRLARARRGQRLEDELAQLPPGDELGEQKRAEHSLKETFYLRGLRTKLTPQDAPGPNP